MVDVAHDAQFCRRRRRILHPVAESAVIAGNAYLGAEIIEDQPHFDAVVVPSAAAVRQRHRVGHAPAETESA